MGEHVEYRLDGKVAVITMDDGKANALSQGMLAQLHAALDRAESEASAVLLVGRERRLSAGFDLTAMTSSVEAMRALVIGGAELLLRVYLFPVPVLVGCTGHALAAGALLLLAADERIGVEGDYKIGLNEVSIQMPLPVFAVELARDRLSQRQFGAATMQGRIYDPVGAVDAGYLDSVVSADVLHATVLQRAQALAAIPGPAFRLTKQRVRGAMVATVRESLVADVGKLTSPRVG